MKIRHGFVSNSSSSSFLCIKCRKYFYANEYMGGVPEEVSAPEEVSNNNGWFNGWWGICPKCSKKHDLALCPECEHTFPSNPPSKWVESPDILTPISQLIKVTNLVNYGKGPKYFCLKHWLELPIVNGWIQKIKNPNYRITREDKKIARLIGDAKCQKVKKESNSS